MEAGAPSRYVRLELPEEALLLGVAEEGSIGDADLDALEAALADPGLEPERAASAGLVLGRAGRASSAGALVALGDRLAGAEQPTLAATTRLAGALLAEMPTPGVERAESGYRFTEPDGAVLYVEDALGAYWHRRGLWGPPIRPRWSDPDVVAVDVESASRAALDGWLVRVDLEDGPLWLTRAGLGRERRARSVVRWPSVRSIGYARSGWRRRLAAAYATDAGVVRLSAPASIPVEALHDLLVALADRALRR